jgi:DHA1 family bicyclomycin/chloramphenicol resistance-like MFS transporter
LQEIYGFSPVAYGVSFGACAAAYVAGTLVGQVTTPRFGLTTTLGLGASTLAASGAVLALFQVVGPGHGLEVVLPQIGYMVGLGLTLPPAMAGALMPFPERAGAASSLMGFLQMTTAAVLGAGVGALLGATPWPMVLLTSACGIGVLLVFLATREARAAAMVRASTVAAAPASTPAGARPD